MKGSRGAEQDLDFEEVAVKTRTMKEKKRDPYDSSSSDGFVSELSDWDVNENDFQGSTTIRYERPAGQKAFAAKSKADANVEYDSEGSEYDEEEEESQEEQPPAKVEPTPPPAAAPKRGGAGGQRGQGDDRRRGGNARGRGNQKPRGGAKA